MRIEKIQTFHVDAGWRPWSFVKITTDQGLVGWSECTDSHGSPRGIEGVIKDLEPLLVGEDPRKIELLCWRMTSRTRQSPGSIVQKAIGGIENALWDVKAKALGVPVYELFGGPVRDEIRLYWSHCGTSRVRAADIVKKPAIRTLEDIREFGQEVKESGFTAVKTNLAMLGGNPCVYMPGFFKSQGGPSLNPDAEVLRSAEEWVSALRDGIGDDIGLAVDLNFNFKPEGYIKIGRILEQYDPLWLEIDSYDPEALRYVKESLQTPIVSCENLFGLRQYRPYFSNYAMDIASVDVIWNGFSVSKKISDMADIHEMNVCPHNYNGHLSTFISIQFCALVPNLRIAEIDVDDVPWRDELFTNCPVISKGVMKTPTNPGWGTDVDETIAKKYAWCG